MQVWPFGPSSALWVLVTVISAFTEPVGPSVTDGSRASRIRVVDSPSIQACTPFFAVGLSGLSSAKESERRRSLMPVT